MDEGNWIFIRPVHKEIRVTINNLDLKTDVCDEWGCGTEMSDTTLIPVSRFHGHVNKAWGPRRQFKISKCAACPLNPPPPYPHSQEIAYRHGEWGSAWYSQSTHCRFPHHECKSLSSSCEITLQSTSHAAEWLIIYNIKYVEPIIWWCILSHQVKSRQNIQEGRLKPELFMFTELALKLLLNAGIKHVGEVNCFSLVTSISNHYNFGGTCKLFKDRMT